MLDERSVTLPLRSLRSEFGRGRGRGRRSEKTTRKREREKEATYANIRAERRRKGTERRREIELAPSLSSLGVKF